MISLPGFSKRKFTVKRLAIDLGTANTLMYLEGVGVVLNEPTVVALSAEDGKIMAIGAEARDMLGRTPQDIVASRPLKEGVVADYERTESMIRYFMKKIMDEHHLSKVEVLACVPSGATSIERRAVLEAVLAAGAKNAYLLEESVAAAIGANVPIGSTEGNMIVDLGGGTTEIAVICLGGIVVHDTVRVGGYHMDEAINSFIRRKHNLLVGERMAEEVKLQLAAALANKQNDATFEVKGRNTIDGLPNAITVSSDDIFESIRPLLEQIITSIKNVLEQTPPELASDIIDRGIVLSGGGAALPYFDRLISVKTGVPVHVADEPLLCVVKGAGKVVDQFATFAKHLRKY